MTPKNRAAIAKLLHDEFELTINLMDKGQLVSGITVLMNLRRKIADVCEQDNPTFSRTKFYDDCAFTEMASPEAA